MGSEFIIHVPDEYDYRYSSFDKWLINKYSFLISISLKKMNYLAISLYNFIIFVLCNFMFV